MSKYFVCCEECFEIIGKRNTNAARLWMDLCAISLKMDGVLTIKTLDFPELRILETMGLIVTTDKPESILVFVKGRSYTQKGEPFFCVKECLHE